MFRMSRYSYDSAVFTLVSLLFMGQLKMTSSG
jgi:hypothetical protein